MELAVYEDCRKLIEQFVQCDSAEFKHFQQQWNQMMFQHLWAAQTSTTELMQTTAAALHVAKRLACGRRVNGGDLNISDMKEKTMFRVAGIYLMYSIFFKQPNKPIVKIEISPQTYLELKELIDTMKENIHTSMVSKQVCFMYYKLKQSNAFRYTAQDYNLGLEQLVRYDKIIWDTDAAKNFELETGTKLKRDLKKLTTIQEIVPSLNEFEDSYNEMKRKLYKQNKIAENALPPTKIVAEVKDLLDKIESTLSGSKCTLIPDNTRSHLKRKAYISNEYVNSDGDSSNQDEPKETNIKYMGKRMSAHTLFKEELPSDTILDLESADKNSEDSQYSEEELNYELNEKRDNSTLLDEL